MNESESKLVGLKIKFLRNKMNITIEELAYRTGIDYSYLAKMEKGKVNFTLKKLIQLSKVFDIELIADKNKTKKELIEILNKIYSTEEQKRYGVVGIEIKVMKYEGVIVTERI